MIGFNINDEALDLEPGTMVQVEYFSSLFDVDRIPGMLTYPITLPWSKKNKRLLGFPGQLSVRSYRKEPFACSMYLSNLWRVGKLFVLGTSDKGISVNFQSDVGDLGEAFKNDSLRDLDLGTDQLVDAVRDIYPATKYALFPVRNPAFYDGKNPDFCQYLNYYDGGFKTNLNSSVHRHARTPFPYLVYIMRRVMAHYGYTLSGAWLEEEETRRLVIYNTQSLDQPGSASNAFRSGIRFNEHVPDMKVNEFMKAIRAAFGLAYIFNTTTKTMEILRLRDVICNTDYVDWRPRNLHVKEWKPNESEGFRLELKPDSGDALNEQLPDTAFVYQTGKGKQAISTALGTLQMHRGEDALKAGRHWLLPEASQKGGSAIFGGEAKFSLRLLSYRGLQPDNAGALYPLGTSSTANYGNQEIGSMALAWSGTKGLYEQCHRHWLEFLSETETIETEIDLNMSDLRTLRQELKVMVRDEQAYLKALWGKVSVSVSLQDGIKRAKVPLYKVRN